MTYFGDDQDHTPVIEVVNQSGVQLTHEQIANAVFEVFPQHVGSDLKLVDDPAVASVGSDGFTEVGGGPRFAGRRTGTSIQNKFVSDGTIFDDFRTAKSCSKDDETVSNAVSSTTDIAFKRLKIEALGDPDGTDVWQQIADDIELIDSMREIWKDLFTYSQVYVAVEWGSKTYQLKGVSEKGNKTTKSFKNVRTVTGLSVLDPCKVVPVGDFLFGRERLAWIADGSEMPDLDAFLSSNNTAGPGSIESLIESKYTPSESERQRLEAATGSVGSFRGVGEYGGLYLLKEDCAFRVTDTRPHYEMFADVGMRAVFELVDLKHNLREMDRSDILTNINALVLIKKGSDERPAKQEELNHLQGNMGRGIRQPVIVSDHRLTVEYITRKTDWTLRPERYNSINSSITSRLLKILSGGNYVSGTALDDSKKLFQVIAAGMESRRDVIRRALQKHIFYKIAEQNNQFKERPQIRFSPRRIALEFDQHFVNTIQNLLNVGAVSYETALSELDIDIEEEAMRIKHEKEVYGDVFDFETDQDRKRQETLGRMNGGNNNGGGSNPAAFNEPEPKVNERNSGE